MSVSRDAASAQEPGADLLAAAFLEAGFRHIAVQNTRTPVQRMNDVAAATSHTAALVGQLVDHPKMLGFRPI